MATWLRSLSGGGPISDLVMAGVVLAAGLLCGRLLSALAMRLLRRWSHALLGMAERFTRLQGAEAVARADAETAAVRFTGRIVFWIVFAVALATATTIVGVPVVSSWLTGLADYLPQVLAAGAIVL